MKIEELIKIALDSSRDIYYSSIEYESYQFDKKGIKVNTITNSLGESKSSTRTIVISWDTIIDITNDEDIYMII